MSLTTHTLQLKAEIPASMAGQRLDQALAKLFEDYSRSRLQQWIRAGQVLVDGVPRKTRDKVDGGEQIEIAATLEESDGCEPEAIPLDILYQDESLLVVNKPVGLVVHPAAGNWDGTLQNALLHLDPSLAAIPRAGIVHRLDKDTSGLMVVARSLTAHHHLVKQLQERRVTREYQALVGGVMMTGGSVDEPIGRHPVNRKRMAVVSGGKPAITHYRVRERFRAHTWVQVRLETGRTHQIRVHMAHIRHPLVGDQVYRGRLQIPAGSSEALQQQLRIFRRQALHAGRLALEHPVTGKDIEVSADMPDDMRQLIEVMREDAKRGE